MIRTDNAIDMYIELAPAIDGLTTKLKGNTEWAAAYRAYMESKDNNTVLFRLVPALLKAAKNEVYELIAVYEGKTVDDIKAQPIQETIQVVMEVFNNKELTDFFTSAVPPMTTGAQAE